MCGIVVLSREVWNGVVLLNNFHRNTDRQIATRENLHKKSSSIIRPMKFLNNISSHAKT